MRYENFDFESMKFQNDIFADNPMHKTLNSEILFTRDIAEVEAAAERASKNPLNISDTVYLRVPEGGLDAADAKKLEEVLEKYPEFRDNLVQLETKETKQPAEAAETVQAPEAGEGSDFCAYTSEEIERKIQKTRADLDRAQERLEWAMENQVGVLTAMMNVEGIQKLLDQYAELKGKALEAEAKQASSLGAGVTLGSVSIAQWKLEQAYKSGKSWEINYAKNELAREKAKEAANKMK